MHRDGRAVSAARELPEKTAIAISCNGTPQAVMMAAPANLENVGIGSPLSEGVADSADESEALEILEPAPGLEIALWPAEPRAVPLAEGRRTRAGPVGCGLCGIKSLDAAVRPPRRTSATGLRIARHDIAAALARLREIQALHDTTRAWSRQRTRSAAPKARLPEPARHAYLRREEALRDVRRFFSFQIRRSNDRRL